MALLGVDEVRKFVADRGRRTPAVVADQIPIAFLGIELEREAAHVALGVGRAELAGDGGEARDHRRLGAPCSDALAFVYSEYPSDRERAVGTAALGVDRAFGETLADLMGELFDQLVVRAQHRTAQNHAVIEFWLSGTGAPAVVLVNTSFSAIFLLIDVGQRGGCSALNPFFR